MESSFLGIEFYLMRFHSAIFRDADEVAITRPMQKLFLLNHIKMFHGSHQKVLIYGNCSFANAVLKIQMVCIEWLFSVPHPPWHL